MKKFIALCLIVLLLVFSSAVIAAKNIEVNGGYLYTKLDIKSDDFFATGFLNNDIETEDYSEYDKVDRINDATGYFIELNRDLGVYKIGLQYEKFSQEEKGYIINDVGNSEEYTSANIDIDGIVVNFGKPINEYFDLFIGIGRYNSDIKEEHDYIDYYDNGDIYGIYSYTFEYDVDSNFGYKLGAKLNYPFNSSWSIIGNINYRILQLDYEIDKVIDSSTGEIDKVEQDAKDEYSGSLDLNGFELSVGIAYIF